MDSTFLYFCDFKSMDDGVQRAQHGDGRGWVRIAAQGNRLLIVLEGEPQADTIMAALQTGLDAGWLHVSMMTLVDLTDYVGVVDWASLKRLSELAEWGTVDPGKSAVAYVVRSSAFGMVIKVISALFGRTRHHAFSSRADAVAWLTE